MATKKRAAPKKQSKPKAVAKPAKPKGPVIPQTAPPAYLRFVERDLAKKNGMYCWGLPHFTADTKLKLRFEKPGASTLFADAQVDPSTCSGWAPLARLDDPSRFLVVKLADEACPVALWHQGALHSVSPSLADFTRGLVLRDTPTAYDRLDAAVERAVKLREKEKFAQALALVAPLLDEIPSHVRLEGDEVMARAFNLRGICLENLERNDEALASYEKSIEAGDSYAWLNVLDLHQDAGEPQKVVDAGEKMKRETWYLDDHCATWVRRYLARAYLELGQAAKAEAELRELLERFEIKDTTKVREARAGLEDFIAQREGTPVAAQARAFLSWFKEKTWDVTPEQAAKNRAWYEGLPDGLKAALKRETKIDRDREPADTEIARFFDVTRLSVGEGDVDDVSIFVPFSRLVYLQFKGDPDTLEALRPLKKLERVTWNLRLLKQLEALPSRADRDLLAAAAQADRAGMERALSAGANIAARDWHGHTALALAMRENRDVQLALWLIGQGADPWASDHHDNRIWFDAKDQKRVEAEADRMGMARPETSPWRVLEWKREDRSARFGSPRGMQNNLELMDGERFLTPTPRWPKNVRYEFTSNKKDDKLYDLHETHEGFIVSDRVRLWLEQRPVFGLELLPVTLVDRNNKVRKEPSFALNPMPQDCLDEARSNVHYNHIDPTSFSDYVPLVIDETRLDPKLELFRVSRLNSGLVVMRRAFAEALAGQGFTGVGVGLPRR